MVFLALELADYPGPEWVAWIEFSCSKISAFSASMPSVFFLISSFRLPMADISAALAAPKAGEAETYRINYMIQKLCSAI